MQSLQSLQGGDMSNQAAPPEARHAPVGACIAVLSLTHLPHADIAPVTVPHPKPTSMRDQVQCSPSMSSRSIPRSPTRCWRLV